MCLKQINMHYEIVCTFPFHPCLRMYIYFRLFNNNIDNNINKQIYRRIGVDLGQLYPQRTRMHRRVTNHINMLADISGFSCHFGAKFQILLRYANLLITTSNHHVGHANRHRIAYMIRYH